MSDVEKAVALRLLMSTSASMSAALDGFAMWVLAGYGAILGFLVGQAADAGHVLDPRHLKLAGTLYLVSMFPALIEKAFATLNVAQAGAGHETNLLMREIAESGQEFDRDTVFELLVDRAWWPQSEMIRRGLRRATSDIVGPGRLMRDRVGWQIFLVAIQIVATVCSIAVLIAGIDAR